MNDFNFKELYEVSLKATYPIEVGGKKIEVGETIASFDRIQIANLQEIKQSTAARGGFDNRGHVFWETTKEVKINFVQGVFSKIQLALMINAKLIENNGEEIIPINKREQLESDENRKIIINHKLREPIFIYDAATGEKLTNWTLDGTSIILDKPYQTVIVDYWYEYNNGCSVLIVGRPLTQGFFSLSGKTRIKDDITGQVKTGIITIPKFKLMSDLSMRLGSDAIPLVGRLDAIAVPVGARGQEKVMEIAFLNDDIDADM